MFKFIVDWFKKPHPESLAPAVTPEAAPYKVEAPQTVKVTEPKPVAPAKCGCGRSPSGLCVGLHKLTPEQWAAEQARGSCQKSNNSCDKPSTPCPEPATSKKPAAKKAPAKKPAAMSAKAKKAPKKK